MLSIIIINTISQSFHSHDWSKHITWLNIREYSLILKTKRVAQSIWNNSHLIHSGINKHNSLHLGRKYTWIFVLEHDLFLQAHSFPRATLSENCFLLGTDNVRGQISEHIFASNEGYCLFMQGLSQAAPLRQSRNEIKMSRPKMIKGSICPLKRRAIFATNFTEVFLRPKMQELIFNENSTINGTIFQLTLCF